MSLSLTSSAVSKGGRMPLERTCDGDNASPARAVRPYG